MELKNKTAIITGGGRGFGKAIATSMVKEGMNVVLASPDTDEIEGVAKAFNEEGFNTIAVTTDISKKAQVENMAKAAFDAFGEVDVLVNNGGVAAHSSIQNIDEDDWDFVLAVNLKGTMLCTQAVFDHMCKRGSGHIINIGSGSGKVGTDHMGPYVASKFGVVGFTQVTDCEGLPHGVKATVVNPGAAATNQRSQFHEDDTSLLLQPEDVAEAVMFVLHQNKRAYTPEISVSPQFSRRPPKTTNLRDEVN